MDFETWYQKEGSVMEESKCPSEIIARAAWQASQGMAELEDHIDKYFKHVTPEQLDKDLKEAGIDVYSNTKTVGESTRWFRALYLECEQDPRFHAECALMDFTEKIIEINGQPKGVYKVLFWLLDWAADRLIWRKREEVK